MYSKRGVVAVRSLKSGYGDFLQDVALSDEEISQLEAGFLFFISLLVVLLDILQTHVQKKRSASANVHQAALLNNCFISRHQAHREGEEGRKFSRAPRRLGGPAVAQKY